MKSFSEKKEKQRALTLLKSGNLPEFAQGNALSFWMAADTHERVNGRVYTELQVALPRELDQQQRSDLAKKFTSELLGSNFTHTLAVHTSLLEDGSEQSYMHLLFSERTVTDQPVISTSNSSLRETEPERTTAGMLAQSPRR